MTLKIVKHPLYTESKKKWHKWIYLQKRNILTDLENGRMDTGGKDGGKG